MNTLWPTRKASPDARILCPHPLPLRSGVTSCATAAVKGPTSSASYLCSMVITCCQLPARPPQMGRLLLYLTPMSIGGAALVKREGLILDSNRERMEMAAAGQMSPDQRQGGSFNHGAWALSLANTGSKARQTAQIDREHIHSERTRRSSLHVTARASRRASSSGMKRCPPFLALSRLRTSARANPRRSCGKFPISKGCFSSERIPEGNGNASPWVSWVKVVAAQLAF
ncbi:hypothetical protein VFPFJ_08176 [Purpureocillium lilacinum]|uniref:Uncharacterized protein n=1 Tax=Purpureocillium lilacinum TaxID=33203 RepID=A0A179H6K4_PURLI|nr:hypothetical protein VFPFJ_08176 [Purpureocillium lilacinum]OAQ85787.1 hypothetical protein VFPFJ_08176 [Purpureocillium lilacinum]